ncbi:MAG: GNAT family N-acetyltransferase [Ruminiclostridium sp.]|nr:GNAT family N-acetyltransferase [Ruminiclostridium sp.]
MTIRKALDKDLEGIKSLLLQVLTVHHNGRPDIFKGNTRKYTDDEIVAIIHNEKTPVLIAADENDSVMGYAFCVFQQHIGNNILTDIKTLYIDDLCVDENIRGKHIGSALYNAVLDFARENGCYNVTLNVWSCNESAMRFYEKMGLKPQKVGMEKIL